MNVKKSLLTVIFMFLITVNAVFSSTVTSVSGVSITPSNPSPGDTVTLQWTYNIADASNKPHAVVVVSDQCTLRKWGTSGQTVVIGDGCTGDTDAVNGGCQIGSDVPAGANVYSTTITIPSTLIPGYTYYVAVGTRDYNIYINNDGEVLASNQACVSFSIPLPPPYITLSKIAEGSAATPNGLVLYTIFYDVANTNNVVITDAVPSDMTFVEAYDNGTYSAGTVTWNIGNVTSPVKNSVSFLARVNGTVTSGSVIHNTASGHSNEVASSVSNDAPVTIGVSLKVGKFADPHTVNVGQTMTFNLTYTNEGYTLSEYNHFSSASDISSWTTEVAGATWSVTGGKMTASGPTGQWGKIIKNTPSLHNAMYITDVYVPSTNPTGDAAFVFNFIDIGNMYHARIQTDTNQLCFDKVVGTTWSSIQCISPGGFTMQNNAWYTIKVQVNGSNFKLKVWPKTSPEPSAWQIDRTDTSLGSNGRAGYQDNEGDDWFDNLKIFAPAPATNMRVWDSLPPCITYIGCNYGCTYSSGVVSWAIPGTQGNTVNTVSFWASADTCANNSSISNTGCVDSDEPAPSVCSNIATVVVGALPSPTVTVTSTSSATPSPSNTPTITATPTITETPLGTSTSTPTITATPTFTVTRTITETATASSTPTSTPSVTPTRTPAPAMLDITLEPVDFTTTSGGYAQVKITVMNSGMETADNVVLWDSVPADTSFAASVSENLQWDINGNVFSRNVGSILPGASVTYYFTLKVADDLPSQYTIHIDPAQASFNDVTSPLALKYSQSLPAVIAIGDIFIYPNPFDPKTAVGGKLKFANVPRDARIRIYSISGELVTAYWAKSATVYWEGTNNYGKKISPGIYYYFISWDNEKRSIRGKIFVTQSGSR